MSSLRQYFDKVNRSQELPAHTIEAAASSLAAAGLRVTHYFKHHFPQALLQSLSPKNANSLATDPPHSSGRRSSNPGDHQVKYGEFKSAYFVTPGTDNSEKTKQIQIFIKKLQNEQFEREKRRRADLEKRQKALDDLEEQSKAKLLEEAQTQQTEKMNRLEKLREQVNKRKEEARAYKALLANHPKSKPLFRRLEEEYIRTFEIPELQRRKEELAKKRDLLSPVRLKDLTEHMRAYELSKNNRKYRSSDSLKSGISQEKYKDLLSELRQDREKSLRVKQDKRLLVEKRDRFSEHVKSNHKPKTDPLKQAEMELARCKAELPTALKSYKEAASASPPKGSTPKFTQPLKHKPKRTPEPIVEAEYTAETDNKPDDYLEKRRKIRMKLEEELLLKNGGEAAASEDLELKAKRCEGLLKYRVAKDPFSLEEIDAEDYVNQLYIQNIKNKISGLE